MRRGNQSSRYSDSSGRRRGDQRHGHERTRSPPPWSQSPGDRDCVWLIRGNIRERAHSLERRGFGRHAGENIDQVHPGQSHFDSRRVVQPGSAEIGEMSLLDEGFSHLDSPSSEFRRSFLVPELRGSNMEVNNDRKLGGLRSDPSVRIKQNHFGSGNNISVDHRMLVQKSPFLDDGNSHSLFALPFQRCLIEDKPAGLPMQSDMQHDDFGSAQVRLRKAPPHEPYELEGHKRPKLYSRAMPYSSSAQTSTTLGISSSVLSKDFYLPSSYPTSLHLSPVAPPRGETSSDVISDPPGNLFDTILDPDMRFKNLKLYQTPVSPVRDGPRPYAYSAFGKRERDPSGFSDNDLYKKINIDDKLLCPLRETLGTTRYMETVGDAIHNDTARRSFIGRASWDHPLHGEQEEILHDTYLQPCKSQIHEEFFSSRKVHQDFPISKTMDRPFINLTDDHEYGREDGPLSS